MTEKHEQLYFIKVRQPTRKRWNYLTGCGTAAHPGNFPVLAGLFSKLDADTYGSCWKLGGWVVVIEPLEEKKHARKT